MVIVLAASSPQTQKKKRESVSKIPSTLRCILKLTLINFYLEEKKEACFEWSLKTTDTYIKPPPHKKPYGEKAPEKEGQYK